MQEDEALARRKRDRHRAWAACLKSPRFRPRGVIPPVPVIEPSRRDVPAGRLYKTQIAEDQ